MSLHGTGRGRWGRGHHSRKLAWARDAVFLVSGTATSPMREILRAGPRGVTLRERELAVVSTIRNRAKEPDQVCADAVDLARQSLVDQAGVSPDTIGDHLGVEAAGDRVVTHFFDCADRAYAGWRWAVTVARAPRSKTVTVDESVLLPGPDVAARAGVGALAGPAAARRRRDRRPAARQPGRRAPCSLRHLDGDDAVTDWFLPRTDTENADAGPRPSRGDPLPGPLPRAVGLRPR